MSDILLAWAVLLLVVHLLLGIGQWFRKPPADRTGELLGHLGGLERVTSGQLQQIKADLIMQRQELLAMLGQQGQMLTQAAVQQQQTLEKLGENIDAKLRFAVESQARHAQDQRQEHLSASQLLSETLRTASAAQHQTIVIQLRERLGEMAIRLDRLSVSMRADAEAMRTAMERKILELQNSNEQRLEQMRQTVDEKLHATLEARLGQSFQQVSERLEAVHQGLGEMKALADGVGDLKKVMTNVKSRGTWGEVQLRNLIEDILRPEEFVANFAPRGGNERVEFAVRLPGGSAGQVYLPLDAKFPVEDYQRLVDAQENADVEGVRIHGRALEDRIKACAKDICDKYLEPGVTTEYAILFLPFEGLYAEVLRRPGLADHVQRTFHVAICGPTTLGALLTSLRMGFRAVAIQHRSSDIAALLAAVKGEFGTFGKVIEAVSGRLKQAQDEIGKVGVRSRAIERKLQHVEASRAELEQPESVV